MADADEPQPDDPSWLKFAFQELALHVVEKPGKKTNERIERYLQSTRGSPGREQQGLGLIVFGVFAGAHGRPRNASARAGSRPMWRNPAAIRVCPACRSSPMARLRKAAMTCGPALVRMRLASSAKVTSRTQCSPSTCQCARSNAPSRSASAWSAVRQVTA